MFLSAKRNRKSEQPLKESRRQFFKHISAVVVGGLALGSGAALGGRPFEKATTFNATGSTAMEKNNEFSPYLGDQFEIISAESGSQKVKLQEVTDRSPAVNTDDGKVQQESFSLLFRGSNTQPLVQNTYSFKHPGMGSFALFIVPVGKDDAGMQYEAVINRLVS